jgi:ATP-dependent Clp protease ATP-binding subunit ClpC
MLENFTQEALKVVMYAQEEARAQRNVLVEPDHLFLGLLRDPGTLVSEVLHMKGLDAYRLRSEVDLAPLGRKAPMDIAYSETTQLIFKRANAEARLIGVDQVDVDHLLLGLVYVGEGQGLRVLSQSGLQLQHLRWNLLRLRYTRRNQEIRTAGLDRYSQDLTSSLEQQERLRVMEWEPMVERLIQYLGMQHKHNVLLVGEHGVGKSSLIDGLNQYILDSRIYQRFSHFRVVVLSIDKMLAEAGTTDEELYGLTQSIMQEVRQSEDILLVIENIHQLFLASKKELEFVITQQLLTLLEEPGTYCVATTTPHFFKRLQDETLVYHLFQIFEVPEPPLAFCTHILKQKQAFLESHHSLEIAPSVLDLTVRNAKDKVDGFLPQAALHLLDLAAARKSWQYHSDQQQIEQLQLNLKHLAQQRMTVAEAMADSPAAKKVFEDVKARILKEETRLQRLQHRYNDDVLTLEDQDILQIQTHPIQRESE